VPHQLCQFHSLREVPLPGFEAGRHANEGLKKQVRSVRPIKRAVEARDDAQADAGLGCSTAMPCPACRAPTTTLSNGSGRKRASLATVLRGEVRLIAAVATPLQPPTAAALGRSDSLGRDAPAFRPGLI
jgi:hypothetical protein